MIISKDKSDVNIEDVVSLFEGVTLESYFICPLCGLRAVQETDVLFYCPECDFEFKPARFGLLDNKDISGEARYNASLDKVKKYSDVEYVCGNLSEVYQYERPVIYNRSARSILDHFCKHTPKGQGKNKDENLSRSFRRRKQTIRRYINSNVKDILKCSFLTLTYAQNMQDQSQGYIDLKNFLKRLRYHYPDFNKYLWCVERQKRGAIHFHIVFFDVPKIEAEELSLLWGKGFIKINQCDGVNNLGAYMTKYMGKESQKLSLTGRIWGHSENLLKCKIVKNDSSIEADKKRDFSRILYSTSFDTKWRGIVYFHVFKN